MKQINEININFILISAMFSNNDLHDKKSVYLY